MFGSSFEGTTWLYGAAVTAIGSTLLYNYLTADIRPESKMPVNLVSLGSNLLKKVPLSLATEVPLSSLWAEQTVVITFFRRFGRQGAKELSLITPLLASHNVKNVGVGLEEFGLEDFVKGQYFNGELYVDIKKKTYRDLGYKKYSTAGVLMSLTNKKARDAIARNKIDKLDSNLQGDGLQTGGTLIIAKGGEQVLLDFRQDNPADHVSNAEILRVLGIPDPLGEGGDRKGASAGVAT